MNEIEFIVRRILKTAHEWAAKEHQVQTETPAMSLHSYVAHQRLISHLEKTFLEGKINEQD